MPSDAFTLIKPWANALIGCGAGVIAIFIGVYAFLRYRKHKKKREIRARISPTTDALLEKAPVDDFEDDEVYDSQAALNIAAIKKGRVYKRRPWYELLKNALISALLLYLGVLLTNNQTNWLVSGSEFAAVGYFLIVFGSLIEF